MSVRHALLALLSEGPKYGLQLGQEFEARTGEVWPLNIGQVYTTLQRLERDGLVESDDAGEDGPQKGFRITAAGARASCASGCGRRRTRRRRRATSWSSRCWSRCGCRGSTSSSWCRRTAGTWSRRCSYYTRLKEDAGDDEVGSVAGGGRRAVPARRGDPVARRRRRPDQAAPGRPPSAPRCADVAAGRGAGWGRGDDGGARTAAGVEVLRRGADLGRGVAGGRPGGRRR